MLYPEVESKVLIWVRALAANHIPFNGPRIRAKAKEIADQYQLTGFKASHGWLCRFLSRHDIGNPIKRKRKSAEPCDEADVTSNLSPPIWYSILLNKLKVALQITETKY